MIKKIWNKVLDTSIYFSFDQRGYKRHEDLYFENEAYAFSNQKKALVTGGTSGIGKEVALQLSNHKVNVTVTGRNEEKGNQLIKDYSNLSFLAFDLADWESFPDILKDSDELDYLVLNAGGMPEKFQQNAQGVEIQAASQFFGHYYLLKYLYDHNKLKKGARVIWVTSGGMYLKDFNPKEFFDKELYDKVNIYANVKRAQVEYLPTCAKDFPYCSVTAMHPGWVSTPGLTDALTKFSDKLGDNLRIPQQGADTIIWLLGTHKEIKSGSLYFDRKQADKNIWFFNKSKKSDPVVLKKYIDQYQPKYS